jgi:nitrite reductase/ring-hydroxylating ferredoxin subunit
MGGILNTNDDKKLCPVATEGCHASTLSRRRILALAGTTTGLVMLGAIPACDTTGSPPTGPVSGGNVSALDIGTMLVIANVVVGRDAIGVYAMSAICTHEGCFVSDGPKTIAAGLSCGCHGSAFDGDGLVTRGPANRPLQHYAVSIDAAGAITVDGSQPVADSTRTPT